MRLFGLQITRTKAQSLSAVSGGGGWFNLIREPFGGAWQSNVPVDAPRQILAFSAVFSCVTIIASDIAKLCIELKLEGPDGICRDAPANAPWWAVLAKPNHFQNRIKFIEQWIISKLLYGNAYILKGRDGRGVVNRLHVLDPQRVTPLVADNGDVYYRISKDPLSRIGDSITVPAREIIHDMMVSLWHPLVGISPIYACGMSATMGNRIQTNSTKFFDNMSRPSGMLSAPGAISDETANRIKTQWEQNFGGNNIGRLAVLGDGLVYEAMTIPANDAQLMDQLRWTVEDVARCYHVPLYKLGAESGRQAGTLSVEALNQAYYSDCLQALIESLELCLQEGLQMPSGYEVECDLDGLLRMDTAARYTAWSEAVKGGWFAPNEARKREDLEPAAGGDSPYLQQQNYSLAALAKRDAQPDPFAKTTPAGTAPADPAANDPQAAAAAEAAALIDYISKGLTCPA